VTRVSDRPDLRVPLWRCDWPWRDDLLPGTDQPVPRALWQSQPCGREGREL